jgi:plasmid stabilization system protein ParE
MKYDVVVHRMANQDLEEAYEWAARSAPATAERWLGRFQAALQGLELHPERHPKAKEGRRLHIDLHEMLFGKRAGAFRVIFIIDVNTVRIFRILRARRRLLRREEIEESLDEEKSGILFLLEINDHQRRVVEPVTGLQFDRAVEVRSSQVQILLNE